jgi:hypothetical protein
MAGFVFLASDSCAGPNNLLNKNATMFIKIAPLKYLNMDKVTRIQGTHRGDGGTTYEFYNAEGASIAKVECEDAVERDALTKRIESAS